MHKRLLLTALVKKVYKASNNYVFLGLKNFIDAKQTAAFPFYFPNLLFLYSA